MGNNDFVMPSYNKERAAFEERLQRVKVVMEEKGINLPELPVLKGFCRKVEIPQSTRAKDYGLTQDQYDAVLYQFVRMGKVDPLDAHSALLDFANNLIK